ncbi:MAG: hypothetical protein ACO29Y_05845 [Holophagaceae bacterium]
MKRQQLDLLMGSIIIGSAMTFGLITLGFTAYRDSQGLKSVEVSSITTRPQDIEGGECDPIYNPYPLDCLEQTPLFSLNITPGLTSRLFSYITRAVPHILYHTAPFMSIIT